ncbi:MAG: HAMP domain-containing protein [Gammaproteobacteria bacterium]
MTHYFMTFLKILGNDERRKARNLLLKPTLQIKLPLYILILSFTFGGLAMLLGYFYFEQLYMMMLENSTQGSYLQETIIGQLGNFMESSVMLLFGYALLVAGVTIVYTHRLIGPTVTISRHIQALKNGRYSSRISLRKNDELKELAAELNELAEILEEHRIVGVKDN